MRDMVVGFLFNAERDHVVLVLKSKPDWQRGRYNGVGGKVESGEEAYMAMRREFEEETGLLIEHWKQFATLGVWGDEPFQVFFYFAAYDMLPLKGQPDEPVAWFSLRSLATMPLIPNLRWLIPLAQVRLAGWKDAGNFVV